MSTYLCLFCLAQELARVASRGMYTGVTRASYHRADNPLSKFLAIVFEFTRHVLLESQGARDLPGLNCWSRVLTHEIHVAADPRYRFWISSSNAQCARRRLKVPEYDMSVLQVYPLRVDPDRVITLLC